VGVGEAWTHRPYPECEEVFMKLADVRLLVDRFDECIAFYRDVMGLRLKMRIPEGTYAEFEAGDAVLSLYRRELMDGVVGTPYDAGAAKTDRVALIFRVDSVNAAAEGLRDRGAELTTQPHDQEAWGLRVAHVRDPDGTLIELYQPLA
jgi:lactoylglutathione lyase